MSQPDISQNGQLDEKQDASLGGSQTAQCQVGMYAAGICGRPIHRAPAGSDQKPVCLMHSRDPNKSGQALKQQFEQEVESILQTAGTGVADFSQFVFPRTSFHRETLAAKCIFYSARFEDYADFSGATFMQDADFSHTTFVQDAHFHGSTFMQDADFSGYAMFLPDHSGAATFMKEVFFQHVAFARAKFAGVTFMGNVAFDNARFAQDANFQHTTFARDVSFLRAKFCQDAIFSFATLKQLADFSEAQFFASARFRQTEFRKDGTILPGPVFSSAVFSKPEVVTFYRTDLTHALFHGCDVSQMNFLFIDWRKRSFNDKYMVFEEVVDLKIQFADALNLKKKEADERNYRLIEQLYHQLKKNYDDKSDYWTAGDFHYSEMEMKRMGSTEEGRFFGLRRRLHRQLGLVAWYKYVSEYGESYTRPLFILVMFLVLFASLFPVVGLQYDSARERRAANDISTLTYLHPLGASGSSAKLKDELRLWGNSFMTALNIAAFQKELAYPPAYPWGRILALLEVLVTSTIVALLLLAIRRQFRR